MELVVLQVSQTLKVKATKALLLQLGLSPTFSNFERKTCGLEMFLFLSIKFLIKIRHKGCSVFMKCYLLLAHGSFFP